MDKNHVSLKIYGKILFNLIKSDKKLLLILVTYGIIASLFNVVLPLSIQYIAGQVVANASIFPIIIIVFCLVFFLSFYSILKLFQLIAFSYFEKHFFLTKAHAIILSSIQGGQGIKKHEAMLSYAEISHFIKYVSSFIFVTSALIQQFTIGLILTAFYHFSFLIFNLAIFAIVFCVFKIYFLKSIILYKKELNSRYTLGSFILQSEDGTQKNISLKKSLEEYYKRKTNYFNVILSQNIIFLVLYIIANSVFLLMSGLLTLRGYITVPQFLASEIIFSLVFATFGEFTKNLKNIYELLASSKKISEAIVNFENIEIKDTITIDQVPSFYKTLIKIIFIFTTLTFLSLFIVPWYQTSKGKGKIIAYNQDERTQDLTAMVSGRIVKWYASDGQFLKQGDKIAEISDNDPELMLKLQNELDSIKLQFKNAQLSTQTSQINYNRQYDLYEQGLTSRKDFEKSKIEYQKNLSYENEIKAKLIQTDVKFSRQKSQIIIAPKDGYLMNSQSKSSSSYVYQGEVIATFVPQISDPIIEIFIHPNDIPLIHKGQKVRIQIEGWPALRISGWPSTALGTFGGVVSITDNAISDNGMLRVFVIPDKDDSPWPDMRYIKQGTKVLAWVRMGKVSIGYEIWRQINQFPITPDQKLLLKERKN